MANFCSGYRNNSLPLTIPGRRILWRRSSRVFSLVYHPLSLAFLVWKDRNGKTLVHLRDCVWFVHTPSLQHSCSCPRHLAFGTVDALIGKLRSTFATQGRGSDWQPLLGVGSPAACRTVKKYLADVKEEQLTSRIVPCPAELVLLADLAVISQHIETRLLQSSSLEPSQIFVLARDQAQFKVLFFAGDQAADLLQLKTGDILHFWITRVSYSTITGPRRCDRGTSTSSPSRGVLIRWCVLSVA